LNDPYRRSVGIKQMVMACLSMVLLVIAVASCGSGGASSDSNGQVNPSPDAISQPRASRTISINGNSSTPTPAVRSTRTPTARPGRSATPAPKVKPKSGLPTIRYQDLPRQAQDTIRLIDKGGPFPFDRDGITFQNREGILPKKPNGYYHEYTVITPGSSDRGARRIIAGDLGELYYTDDHYDSFREVIR
jgi:ribonuclease T1